MRGSEVFSEQQREEKRLAHLNRKRNAPASTAPTRKARTGDEVLVKARKHADVYAMVPPEKQDPLAPMEKDPMPAGTYVVSRQYPNNAEVVAMNVDDAERLKRGGGGKRKAKDREEQDPMSLAKSIQRTRVTIRRRILAMGADRMLTLTFRDNIDSLDVAWTKFKLFCNLMRDRFPHWTYVAVPEYQERGAVHFHLAISGFYPVVEVRRFWLQAIGGSGGNIDITRPRKEADGRAVAAYLAKYVLKNAIEGGVDLNRRRYSSGGKFDEPVIVRGYVSPGFPIHRMVRDFFWTELSKPIAVEFTPEHGHLTYYAT